MARQVERDKWILYKHTNNFELITAVALDVKNSCRTDISDTERHRMQERLAALDMYKTRNPKAKPLDSMNHRINTLEFYMFGYENNDKANKHFMFSPLGNLFMQNIDNEDVLKKIFVTMLFGIQFAHPVSNANDSFKLYPFRLLLKLMMDVRLNYKLHFDEYAYIVAFTNTIDQVQYEALVTNIIEFRALNRETKVDLFKKDEHCYVNCVYEWQYYTVKLLSDSGVICKNDGDELVRLFHPSKTNSKSKPTGRILNTGYTEIAEDVRSFVRIMLEAHSYSAAPLSLDDPERMKLDVIKEIYSFYPRTLLNAIGVNADDQLDLLELPKLIEEYSNNPNNETALLFEDKLTEGFNMFINVEARTLGGAGRTDIECKYIPKQKKFAVEAKSTSNKLSLINAGRLREHRDNIGGEYTIVITSRYVPAVKKDIKNENIVIILAHTFSEYLYNHIYHDVREIDYEDFDKIIANNLGSDISQLISNKTMQKFATQ